MSCYPNNRFKTKQNKTEQTEKSITLLGSRREGRTQKNYYPQDRRDKQANAYGQAHLTRAETQEQNHGGTSAKVGSSVP